jgi:1,4-alpha-glucan branching enzyme
MFDGTHTYEYADMRKGFHPDWNSYILIIKGERLNHFLSAVHGFGLTCFISTAFVWTLCRLSFAWIIPARRTMGAQRIWRQRQPGGNCLIRDLNETIYRDFPDVQTIAEESTDWPVFAANFMEGLGFGMKWMMGWMHDTLDYFKIDPYYRPHHQNKFTFSMMYFYDENFMLPLSHDEVVHGKSPMLFKMPGDEWQKFANLRTLYTYMWTHPGARLLFMGNEFGQTAEWNYKSELQWYLLQHDPHRKMQECIKALNKLLKEQPAMYEKQFTPGGFQWIDLNHRNECVMVYKRMGKKEEDDLLVIMNVNPVPKEGWQIEVGQLYNQELFNSDDVRFWGTGNYMNPHLECETLEDGSRYRLWVNLPPLSAIILK